MSENFVDTFGFTDAAFNDDSEEDSNEMRRLTNVLSDEDATATASDAIKRAQGIFEAICDQRFTSFPGKFIYILRRPQNFQKVTHFRFDRLLIYPIRWINWNQKLKTKFFC